LASGTGEREALKQAVMSLLGLAQRSGALKLGATAVTRAMREDPPGVVVLARDAGQDLVGKLQRARGSSLLVADLFTAEELAARFGRDRLSVVSVHVAGFVEGLKRHLSDTR
jgi:ribosomal protein L7Ae-like RNA K-turn-binding protein